MSKYLHNPSVPKRRVLVQSFGSGLDAKTDESILNINVAKSVYNFDFSSGALTKGYGLSACDIQRADICSIWDFTRYDFDLEASESILMYSNLAGEVFYVRDGIEHSLDVTFDAKVYAVNYRLYGDDVILMCSEKNNMVVWDGVNLPYVVASSPMISSLTMHYERMFCTVGGEKNSVWFSDDLDPTNWDLELDKGGFIEMLDERGKLNNVLSYLNYVYIFRDYGISRLTAYADQTQFSVSNLFVSSGQIYSNTVSLCGDSVFFLSRDGLYCFNGLSTSKILASVSPLVKQSPDAVSVHHNGKYYVALNMDFDKSSSDGYDDSTDTQNNAVLVYDLKTGSYSIVRGVNVKNFCSYGEILYAVLGDGTVGAMELCGSFFDTPSQKEWASGMLDFGTERVKTVREAYIESDEDFVLKISSERGSKEFSVTPTSGLTKVRVNVSGRKVGVSISSNSLQPRITRPTLVMTVS